MEYVRGRTLREVLAERRRLNPAEALAILEQMLAAIAAAHRAGLVHRDVKPENVLVAEAPSGGAGNLVDSVVKVADFGLARAVEASADDDAGGQLMATVAYVAPELVTDGHADARTDVYSAGIVLFEMLTGRVPVRRRPAGRGGLAARRPRRPAAVARSSPACRRCSTTWSPAPPAATRAAGPPTPARCSPRCRRSATTSATANADTALLRQVAGPTVDDAPRSTRTQRPSWARLPGQAAEPRRPGRRRPPQRPAGARRARRRGARLARGSPAADPRGRHRDRRRDRRARPGRRRRRLVARLRPLHRGARSWSNMTQAERRAQQAPQAGLRRRVRRRRSTARTSPKDIVLTQDPPAERADRQGRHDHARPVAGPGALPGARRGRQAARRSRRTSCEQAKLSVDAGRRPVHRHPADGRGHRAPTRRSAPSSSPATAVHGDRQQGPRADHVPDVVGKNINEARQILQQRRPAAVVEQYEGRATSPRTRCSSRPRPTAPASRRAPRSSSTVSKGPPLVTVPGVIDLPCQQAHSRCCRAGRSRCGIDGNPNGAVSAARTRRRTRRCRRGTRGRPLPALPVTPRRSVAHAGRGRAGPRRRCPTSTPPAPRRVQVYVSNSRGWALPPGDPEQDEAFRAGCARARTCPSYIHASLLVNLGSPTAGDGGAVGGDAGPRAAPRRGDRRAAAWCSTPAARSTPAHADAALRQVREALLPLLDAAADAAARGCWSSRAPAAAARWRRGWRTSGRTSTRSTATRGSASASTPATPGRPGTTWPRPAA